MPKAVMEYVNWDIGSVTWLRQTHIVKISDKNYPNNWMFTFFNYKFTPWTQEVNCTYIRRSEDVSCTYNLLPASRGLDWSYFLLFIHNIP